MICHTCQHNNMLGSIARSANAVLYSSGFVLSKTEYRSTANASAGPYPVANRSRSLARVSNDTSRFDRAAGVSVWWLC